MTLIRTLALAVLLGAPLPLAAPTSAAETGIVTVKVNMARILRINAPANTVIVGNPGVADVTIQDPQTLVLTGKSYGQTNLIVLDELGNPIADTLVEVVQQQADLVTVYQGSSRRTLTCAPICQPTVMLGDDTSYSNDAASSSMLMSAGR